MSLWLIGGALLVLGGAAWLVYNSNDSDLDTQLEEETENVASVDYLTAIATIPAIVALVPLAALSGFIQVLPASWKVYHKIHTWSAYRMQKAASADAVANVRHPNSKEDMLPAKLVESGEEDKSRGGWKVKGLGDKRYQTGVRGGATNRFGKADLIHINEDDVEQGSWAECVIDSALQLDREKYLFRNATVNAHQEMTIQPGGAGQARADGGTADPRVVDKETFVTAQEPGMLEDAVIPLTSEEGFDGQAISWNQYSQIKNEKADQDIVTDAKNSGWLAAKLEDNTERDLIKMGIGLAIWSALLLWHSEIGQMIASFGGGSAVSDAAGSTGLGFINLLAMLGGV
jgi:hypothetical protein